MNVVYWLPTGGFMALANRLEPWSKGRRPLVLFQHQVAAA